MNVNEMKSLTLNGKKYDSFPDQAARAAAAGKLPSPATAKVGDYLVVEEVDAEGKITKVKTAEAPGGGSNSGQNGNGLSATASVLLMTVLKNAVYASDQSANIVALEEALKTSDVPDEPDVPDVPESNVSQVGSVLSIVSGVTVSQSGAILAIS